jgi:predicted MFS family arabinose efflux permease
MGIRQSFGLFLQPITHHLATGREVFSLAIALQNLIFGLPLIGMLADRLGSRIIVAGGGVLYAASFVLLSSTDAGSALYLNLGLLVGIALSSTSYVVVLGAVARVVPPQNRGSVFGAITAAGSLGMFAMVPGVQTLLSGSGWQATFMWLAAIVGIVALLAAGLPGKTTGTADGNPGNDIVSDSILQVLRQARGHSGYLLLNAGFFVCGFHVAFIATHLPVYLADKGIPTMGGATALSMIGLFNIFGSYLFGSLGDRFPKKYLLSLLYFLRAVVIALFLVLPLSGFSAIVFGGMIGFLWLATVPLTSGLVAHIFGARYLSTLYGIVFFSHQVGSFLGVWLGGRLYDTTQSYTIVWLVAVVLGLMAAIVHLPISDHRVSAIPPGALAAASRAGTSGSDE